jgi:DnaK suppressor protein
MARSEALLRLHKSLMSRRAELRKRLGMELEDMGGAKGSAGTGDAADAAFDTGNEEVASQLLELEGKELLQIERAIKRLRQGTYGLCEGCSAKIPVMRLNALPYSTLCIKCAREAELDSGWLEGKRANNPNWDKVVDGDHAEDRQVDLSDLELDLSK